MSLAVFVRMPLDLKIVPVWVGNRQRTYKRCFLQLDTCMYDGGDSKTRIVKYKGDKFTCFIYYSNHLKYMEVYINTPDC